jgi:hypothetical protein
MSSRYSTQGLTALASNAGAGNGSAVAWKGGTGFFTAVATWGGGSAKLQMLLPDGTTWVDVTSVTLSANGYVSFTLPPCRVRTVIATSSAAYVWVQGAAV